MPDDNILPCNCGTKWSRKCEDKRKNCFDLGAFVNDSPIGSRLDWFSSCTALHVSRYGETVTGSLNVWVAIIWQDNIPEIPLAFIIIKERVKKKELSYSCHMNITISQLFEGRYEAINCEAGFLSFTATLCYFSLLLETSHPQKKSKDFQDEKKLSITAEMASYLSVSGDVASLINSAFNIFRIACSGEVGDRTGYFTWYHQVMIYGLLSFLWHLSRVFIVHNLTKCLSDFSYSSVGAAEF